METLSPALHAYDTLNNPEPGKDLERQAKIDILSADLLRDFYQTFRLSQNETAVQPPLFTLLGHEHTRAGHQALLAAALDAASAQVDRLMPPARHTETTEKTRANPENGFRAMWSEYAGSLQNPDPESHRSPEMILDDMIAMDIKYQDKGRPNRTDKDDPYESIVREYVVGDRLTGSPQLLAVREHLRHAIADPDMDQGGTWMVERLEELKASWEAHHPGQHFVADS